MAFQPIPTESPAKSLARIAINKAVSIPKAIIQLHQDEYKRFWYIFGTNKLRSVEELNAIFDEMDANAPGQSALYFQEAMELVTFILEKCNPGPNFVYLPPYPYQIDAQGHVTVQPKSE